MNTNKKVEIISREQRDAADAKYFDRSNKILRGKYKRWAAGLTMQELENAVATFAANNAHGDNLSRREKLMQEAVEARLKYVKAQLPSKPTTTCTNCGMEHDNRADGKPSNICRLCERDAKAANLVPIAITGADKLADAINLPRGEFANDAGTLMAVAAVEIADMKEQSAAMVKRCEELERQLAEEKNRRTLLEAAAKRVLATYDGSSMGFINADQAEQLRAALSAVGACTK